MYSKAERGHFAYLEIDLTLEHIYVPDLGNLLCETAFTHKDHSKVRIRNSPIVFVAKHHCIRCA